MSSPWYFTKEELRNLPSLFDGMTPEDEKLRRKDGCNFIQKVGMRMRFPQLTIATAIIFFHRFFTQHSFKRWDHLLVAIASLFLAGKVEETPKKLKDVITVFFLTLKKDPLKPDTEEYEDFRKKVLSHEKNILETVGFDLTVEHPYKYILYYVKKLNAERNFAQVAWNFVNDSLSSTLCLQYKPALIASSALYLAAKVLKNTALIESEETWNVFSAKIEDLEVISEEILALYENSNVHHSSTSTPTSTSTTTTTPNSSHLPNSSPHTSPSNNSFPEVKKEESSHEKTNDENKLNSNELNNIKSSNFNQNGNGNHDHNNGHHLQNQNNFNTLSDKKPKLSPSSSSTHHSNNSGTGPHDTNSHLRRDKESRRYSPY